MLTTLRQIGNSRGILIPVAFLASCQIEDQVDMQLQDGQIVIKPVKRKLRDGWFGSPIKARILLDQIRNVDKTRLGKKMGKIDEKTWHPVLLEMLA